MKGIVAFESKGVHAFCWTKINFNKNETESKIENPSHTFGDTSSSSNNYHKLKVKLWWVRTHRRGKSAFFVTFILFEKNC